jgi:pseudouridine-5'-phosphate glycosidase
MPRNPYLQLSPDVGEALSSGRPVVALESTIIAHGMPYPQNVQTALEVEQIVRDNGAVPATIAVLDGRLCAGLSRAQLETLGKGDGIWKVSVRDLPYVVSERLPGATTVAATMRVAHLAGIRIFVTGGIGGVHRGAEQTMDVSADLTELAQTPVAVVSAGVKSILDIGRTLEYLETLGVPVVTVGQDAFPSFTSRESGYASPLRLESALEVAAMLRVQWALGSPTGALVANPIPAEMEIPFAEMERVITDALFAAHAGGITGKRLTPFLLRRIADQTGGRSLTANIALVRHNAVLGARIAAALHDPPVS